MAKKEAQDQIIESVKLKDENDVIETRTGLRITSEPGNLTIERYLQLIGLSESYKDRFIVKYTNKPKENEQIEEGKGA